MNCHLLRLGIVLQSLSAIIFYSSCNVSLDTTSNSSNSIDNGKYKVQFSTKFDISENDDGILLTIKRPFNGAEDYQYVLAGKKPASLGSDKIFIRTPVKNIIPVSTSYIPMIEYLGKSNTITGFPNPDYISSPGVRKRINEGSIQNIGNETDFNLETIAEIQPDLIIGYAVNTTSSYDAIKKLGIEVLFNADYIEQHPLGRAEWIKVFGLLYEKYDMADSIFNSIVAEYESAMNTKKSSNLKSVISGSLYGDSWFLPGGENYAARLLEDAGFSYVYESDTSQSFLKLSFESVYDAANNAEYWLSPAPFSSLATLADADYRYTKFTAFQLGNVWCYDKSVGEKGGNNYLELGYLRPDIILKDLIYIKSPELMEGYKPFFYRKLE